MVYFTYSSEIMIHLGLGSSFQKEDTVTMEQYKDVMLWNCLLILGEKAYEKSKR